MIDRRLIFALAVPASIANTSFTGLDHILAAFPLANPTLTHGHHPIRMAALAATVAHRRAATFHFSDTGTVPKRITALAVTFTLSLMLLH